MQQPAQNTAKGTTEHMTNIKDKRQWIKPNQWCWVVQNEDANHQRRFIALILETAKEGEVWVVYKENTNTQHPTFKTGQVLVADIIILNNCRGWDYSP